MTLRALSTAIIDLLKAQAVTLAVAVDSITAHEPEAPTNTPAITVLVEPDVVALSDAGRPGKRMCIITIYCVIGQQASGAEARFLAVELAERCTKVILNAYRAGEMSMSAQPVEITGQNAMLCVASTEFSTSYASSAV